jgi:hypothetical protein
MMTTYSEARHRRAVPGLLEVLERLPIVSGRLIIQGERHAATPSRIV